MGPLECSVPQDKLPPCWSDDVRMNALFAPFRLKAANPESWEMKMKFWSDMLRLWCRCRGDPVVSAADAKVAFQRNGRTSACIDIVIEEMFRNGDLVPLSKYQQILHNGPEGWVRWGARLAFKPAAIALTAVSSLLPARHAVDNDGLPKATIDSTQKFVLESVLKEQAASLLDSYPPGLERVGTVDEMIRRCGWKAGRDAFEMALGSLVETGRAAVRCDLVKLAEPNQKVAPITETDEALVKLSTAETRLEGDATRLSRDVATADSDARAALSLGNRLAAKNHLRRKLTASKRLDRCTAALENVKHLLQQMRDVNQNKAIVDTYKTAAEAMKRDMKENDLNEDTVADTMDDLKEVMETYNEIEKALGGTVDEDAADLEAELRELLAKPGGGGSPAADEIKRPTAVEPPRKISEREFVFDGEERILAELNELGIEDSSPPRNKTPVKVPATEQWVAERILAELNELGIEDSSPPRNKTPVKVPATEQWEAAPEKVITPPDSSKPNKDWYPPASEWNNNFEIRQDERLHPGQALNVDFTTPPRHYSHEFQVHDHKMDGGVWLFNKDNNSNVDALSGTEYSSSESPGKMGSNFQMAPGGERKREPKAPSQGAPPSLSPTAGTPSLGSPKDDDYDDLERRLKKLRGFNL